MFAAKRCANNGKKHARVNQDARAATQSPNRGTHAQARQESRGSADQNNIELFPG